eukprot:5602711-Ditylum_brightwellii.AAC.1
MTFSSRDCTDEIDSADSVDVDKSVFIAIMEEIEMNVPSLALDCSSKIFFASATGKGCRARSRAVEVRFCSICDSSVVDD